MTSNPVKHFNDWKGLFKTRSAALCGSQATLITKCPVADILTKSSSIALARGTPTRLELNILRACFDAEMAPHPDKDEAAQHRRIFKERFRKLTDHRKDVDRVCTYLAYEGAMARKAMIHSDYSGHTSSLSASTLAAADVDELTNLLIRYQRGLERISDFDHPAHISEEDFRYGPFELHGDLYRLLTKPKEINQTGLMFHLAYLFRYFTSQEQPPSHIDIGRDILDVHGVMLSTGRPHLELVAPLVNAVFKTKLSAQNVKDRLRDLYRFSKGSHKPSNPRAVKHTLFLGWR